MKNQQCFLPLNWLILLIGITLLSCASEKPKPIVVIGGGLMGSSTAWQLAKSGKRVLLIEQQDSIYTYGSSLGEARIARINNRGSDIWGFLHTRSVNEAKDLVDFLNSNTQEGDQYSLDDIYTTTPVSYIHQTRIYDKLYSSLIRQKIDYKLATTPEEGRELFDAQLPDSVLLMREYNPYSGTINPQNLIAYQQKAIVQKGNQIWFNHQVTALSQKGDQYEIIMKDLKTGKVKTIMAEKVVSAAGPYTGTLLKNVAPYFSTLITPQRVFLAFLKIEKNRYDQYSPAQKQKILHAYPVINSSAGTRTGSFFSMLEGRDENGNPLIKIGGHFQRSDIDQIDEVWKKDLSPDEITWSKNNTLNYFKLIDVPLDSSELLVAKGYSCVYSLTSTEVPYVTSIPDESGQPNPNFVVLGGLSGVGGKGAMAYGLIATNHLLQRPADAEALKAITEELGFERLKEDL